MENFAKAWKNLVHLEVKEQKWKDFPISSTLFNTFETVHEKGELVIKIIEAGLCISFHYDVVELFCYCKVLQRFLACLSGGL